MGHHVDIAENGKLALDRLQVSDYDIVLMDGRMPEMDGLEATRYIRKGEWNDKPITNPQIKVVALTANVTEEDKQNYLSAGMNDFLRKPVDEQELHHVLADTIDELLAKGKKLKPLIRASLSELDNLFGMPSEPFKAEPEKIDAQQTINTKDALAEKLKAAFVDSLPDRIEEIYIYMNTKNCHELGRIFHGIKGSAGYLKDHELETLSGELETVADAGEIAEIETRLSKFMAILVKYH
jgi:CheY-like chemotaxis protein